MDNSSSSASALEEASMDDSEQEHEYEYDIDDADDDPHDDYDDIPEEEDEEDDDDDMDDQIQALPNDLATLTDMISDRLLSRSDHFVHAIPFRSIRSGNEGFPLDNFVTVGGPFVVPGGRDDSLRSLFMDTFEALGAGGDNPRFLSSMEPVRLEMSNLLSMRPRPHPLPMLTTRLSRNNEPPPAIHPHLAPPRPPASGSSPVDLLSSIARRTPQLASLFDRTAAVSGTLPPAGTRALDALHLLSAFSNQGDASSSSGPLSDYIPSSVPRTGDGLPLHHLLNADLMRTVAIAPQSEGPLTAFARGRATLDRIPARESERSRDKVPSSITRRWRYEPFLSGGDALPPIFDADASRRPPRFDLRSDTVSSNPQPEVPKCIAHTASKVTSTVEAMLVDLGYINENLRAAEKRVEEEKKRLEELKKKEADNALKSPESDHAQPSAGTEGDEVPKMSDDDANLSQSPGPGSSSIVNVRSGTTENPQEPDSIAAEHIENNTNTDSSDHEPDEAGSSPRPDIEPAHEMGDSSDGAMETEDAGDSATVNRPTETNFSSDPVNDEQPVQTANGQFSAIATQRAAAAGISLEAPANENPEVVAAATQSTGIDPAFLAALPEDMRTEILTENYERIRTSTAAQDGTSSSPTATTVNQDFLIALPPALRAEVLELDAEFQARRETQSTPTAEANDAPSQEEPAVAASEMDTATFLATLPPDLREEILLTSGESVIQSLPPNVAAEARVLREREMSSRLPWRVGRSDAGNPFSNGPENRDFGPGRLGSGSGRRGDRSAPREAPAYKWKKVPDGWLREQPNPANEPPASMQPNGLSALVSLLSVGTGSTGKNWNILYQVFSHACKTTELRYVILAEIIGLITSNPDVSPASSLKGYDIEKDRFRFHGTAVRRGLELLLMLCKNDVLVSETLLGLPKNEKELKHVGEHSIEEGEQCLPVESNLSTLISLLRNRLFERSSSHLEQLISAISVVSQAIPSRDVNSPEKLRSRRTSSRTRSIFERHGLSQSIGGDPWNVLYSQLEADDQGMYDPGDDADDVRDVDDSFSRAILRARASLDGPPQNNENNTEKDGKEKEKDAKEIVPVRFRVPALRQADLEALTKVLLRTGCSERTYDRVSRIIGLLGELPTNRVVFMRSLVSIAMDAGTKILKEYEGLLSNLRSGKQKTGADSIFSLGNATNEITLLRVVKSLSTLMKHNTSQANIAETSSSGDVKEEKNSGKSEARQAKELAEKPFRSNVVHGLSEMWAVLDKLLECVVDEVKGKEKKESAATDLRRPTTVAAAAILNGERLKVSSAGLSPTLARLSPMIEAFLVTHCTEEDEESNGDCESSARSAPSTPRMSVSSPAGSIREASSTSDVVGEDKSLNERVAAFVERHRGAINVLLRANPGLLERSFKGVLRHAHAIDFDNKKAYFRSVLRRRSSEAHAGTIRINVRRDRVFDDSYHQLRMRSPDEMKGRLHVQFAGEEGVDAGGVTREWYTILARQIFDPNYVLFTRSAAKAATYQPDKRSYINREHLENFRFVGRIIGKAIYDGQLLDAYFTRSFYKHILGLKPTYHDIEAQDPEYYNSLKWMLENNIDGILDYTMSAEYDEFGKQTVVDLMPNGRNVAVTEENKEEYVRLVTEVRMTRTIEKQIAAFKEGFYELIPKKDCRIFNELELELLMSGLPDIDVADLKENVEYTGFTASSAQVNWFWRCVSTMDQEDLARLVMFVTGTSKVPLEGFAQLQGMNGVQKFQIHRIGGDTMRLPSAHTCFNQLDLPEYSSADILAERLLRAVRECSVGFGFA